MFKVLRHIICPIAHGLVYSNYFFPYVHTRSHSSSETKGGLFFILLQNYWAPLGFSQGLSHPKETWKLAHGSNLQGNDWQAPSQKVWWYLCYEAFHFGGDPQLARGALFQKGCYMLDIPARLPHAGCGTTLEKQTQEVAGREELVEIMGRTWVQGTERGWMLPTGKQKWFYCHKQLKNCCPPFFVMMITLDVSETRAASEPQCWEGFGR